MSDKIFDGVEIPDEALEQVAGGIGLEDVMNSLPSEITVADMVRGYKEAGMSYEEARASLLSTFAKFNQLGEIFSQELIDKNMAEFDAIW